MKLAPRGTTAGVAVAVLVVALGVGASAAAAALAAPTAATSTSSSTTTTTTSPQNIVRSWGFENGDRTGITGIGGATVAIDATARRTGALGLHLGSAANYGAGIAFSFDAAALADGWYDLWFPVRLATGEPIRMQANGVGQSGGPAWVNTGWTGGPYLHFQKTSTTRTVTVQLMSVKLCSSDPASPPSELFVDDVTLRTSTIGPKPIPTFGCPSTTTTAPPVTTTGSVPVTTSPGGLVQHWDFADGTAGWSPLGGTMLGTQADPAGGTDLVVSGVQGPGAGATVTIDATRLQDGTWYDLVVDLRLPSSVLPPIYYRTAANGSLNPPVLLSATAWRGVTAHFRKQPGQASITAKVTLEAQACSDAIGVTGSVLSRGASLYQAVTQAEVPTTTCTGNTPPGTTTTTTPTSTTTPGTVIRRWDFGTSDLAAWSPFQGTTLGTQADPAGGTDLVVSNAGTYGSGAAVTVDTTGLTDNAWYDLGVGLRLPAGSPTTLYRAGASGNWNPPYRVDDAAWHGVEAHFRKAPGQTQQQVSVFSLADCAADPAHAPETFLSNGATLWLSTQQQEITWTTTGCARPTTTTTTPATTTTTPATASTTTTTTTSTTSTTTTRRTTTSTLPHDDPSPYCRVTYGETRWSGGFQGSIALTNISPATISNWVLEFTLTNGSVIQTAWGGGQYLQQGSRVRLPAPSWAPDLRSGQTVQLGFVANGYGTASGFTLNGTPCA